MSFADVVNESTVVTERWLKSNQALLWKCYTIDCSCIDFEFKFDTFSSTLKYELKELVTTVSRSVGARRSLFHHQSNQEEPKKRAAQKKTPAL